MTLSGQCKAWKVPVIDITRYTHCDYAWGPIIQRSDSFEAYGEDGVHILGGLWCSGVPKLLVEYCWGCDERPPCDDPLIVSTKDDTYELTSTEGGVLFDLNSDGELQKLPWIAGSDDAFLVLDRNRNGVIDDGRELFSHVSPQVPSASPNGFLALGLFDEKQNGGDEDGKINSGDKIYESLRLWLDRDRDGRTDSGELLTLSEAGLLEIELKYTDAHSHPDEHGNTFKYSAPAYFDGGRVVDAWAVFFKLESCSTCDEGE